MKEEEVQRAALRTKEAEESVENHEEVQHQTEIQAEDVSQAVNAEVEELLGQELIVDQDASEIILQSLEKGIVLQDGNGLEIQTDEDGQMVYQVLTLQMGEDGEGTTVLTTAPMLEADEVCEIPNEDS